MTTAVENACYLQAPGVQKHSLLLPSSVQQVAQRLCRPPTVTYHLIQQQSACAAGLVSKCCAVQKDDQQEQSFDLPRENAAEPAWAGEAAYDLCSEL